MPRYKLRTLLILLAVLPPVLAVGWWGYSAWQENQEREREFWSRGVHVIEVDDHVIDRRPQP